MLKRRRPRRYVRRNERVGDKVRTHYLGGVGDPVTRVIVESEDLTRALRHSASETAERELNLQERLETCQRFLHSRVLRLFWRRRRWLFDIPDSYPRTRRMEVKMHDETEASDSVSISRDDWDEIVEDAAQGDEEALDELKQILRYNPEICDRLGDVTRHVQMLLIEILGEESIATRESVKMKMVRLRTQLRYQHSDPLERLLIEQVVLTMLDVSIQQIGSSQPHVKETLQRRWERRMDRAQKRHLAAVSALAELRSLLYENPQESTN